MKLAALFLATAAAIAAEPRDVAVIKTPQPPLFTTFSGDGALLAVAMHDALRLYRVADGSVAREWQRDPTATTFALFPRGDRIAFGFRDGRVRVVSVADGAELQSTKADGAIDDIFVAADGKRIAFTTNDGRPFAWTIGAAPVALPRPEVGLIESAAFSPDGKLVAIAADDTTITIAGADDGHLVARIDSLEMAPFTVAFSPDAKRLYAGGANRALMVFDTATWRQTATYPAEAQTINWLDVSADGKRVAARERAPEGGDAPGTIVVWDVSGAAPRELLRERNRRGATGRFVASGEFVYAMNGEDGIHVVRVR